MNHHQRGAALIETALALPVILLAVYGVTYGIRAGTVLERSETAIRYAGVVSAQQNPWHDYSLYSLYNNLGTTSGVGTAACAPPNELYLKGGTLPVAIPGTQQTQRVMPTFWVPDKSQPGCAQTNERQYFSGSTRSYLLLQSSPAMETIVASGFLGATDTAASSTTGYRFYRSPDMSTLMHCAATLNSAVSASLAPLVYGQAAGLSRPLQPSDFNSTPFALTPSCTTGVGSTPPSPAPSLPPYPGGSPPPVNPGNGGSPTPSVSSLPTQPPVSPTPTAAPSTTPSASPSPAKSPTPGPSGSPGGGGGGGGSTPPPPPSPGPGKSATPSPVGSPTGQPTGTPPTPAPSKPPATATPTAKPNPTNSPTSKPTVPPRPSPSPSNPPGGIG